MTWFGRNPDGSPISFRQEIAHALGMPGFDSSGWSQPSHGHSIFTGAGDPPDGAEATGVIGPGISPDSVTLAMPGGLQMEAPVNPHPDVVEVLNDLHGSDIRDHPGFAPMFPDAPAQGEHGVDPMVDPRFELSLSRPVSFDGSPEDAMAWRGMGREIFRDAMGDAARQVGPSTPAGSYKVAKGDALEPIARAIYGEDNWRAGMLAMIQANHIKSNVFGSPLIRENQTLSSPILRGDLDLANRAGGEMDALNSARLNYARNVMRSVGATMPSTRTPSMNEPSNKAVAWQNQLGDLLNGPIGRKAVGFGALRTGRVLGAGEELVDMVKSLPQTAMFLGRLSDPTDLLMAPWHKSAQLELIEMGGRLGRGAGEYLSRVKRDPSIFNRDASNVFSHLAQDYDPRFTPEASTALGEWQRQVPIGERQGRRQFDAASFIEGGELLKGADLIRLADRLGNPMAKGADAAAIADFARGTPRSDYLQKIYDGIGHHFFPERWSKYLGLPKWLRDNPLNIQKFPELTQEQAYKVHHFVDPMSRINRLPKRFGGAWNGKRLGIQRGNLAERLWYGSPQPLKTTIAVPILTGTSGSIANQIDH